MNMHVPAATPRVSFRCVDRTDGVPAGALRDDMQAYRHSGRQAARALPEVRRGRSTVRQIRRRAASLRVNLQAAMARTYASPAVRAWLTDNARLLASAVGEARDFLWNAHDYPSVTTGRIERPRVSVLAGAYLEASYGGQFR
jgi:hypothetical protein